MTSPPGGDPPRWRPELARSASQGQQPVPAPGQQVGADQSDVWVAAEVDITRELVSWRKRFVTTDRRVDTSSERGRLVVTTYLLL